MPDNEENFSLGETTELTPQEIARLEMDKGEDKEPPLTDDQIQNYKEAVAMKVARNKASREERIATVKKEVLHKLKHGEHIPITDEMRELGLEVEIIELIMSAGIASRFNRILTAGDEEE